MRIAFYAPMKPPDAATPSGDRRMARLLIDALTRAGHDVSLASRLRSWSSDPDRHAALRAAAQQEAERFLESGARPDLWFTYHLYYKAPDWIGPAVSAALGIPYIVAEASHAPKRAAGPWAQSHADAESAIRQAAAICTINPLDGACVLPLLDDPVRLRPLPPFLEHEPFDRVRAQSRAELLRTTGFDGDHPVALTVAMMRRGDKRESYRVLAAALMEARAGGGAVDLAVIGDGEARRDIERDFAPLGAYVRFLGARQPDDMPALLAGGDLFLWPAVKEAYGMAMLEAQAAGLPVIAGESGGVSSIVEPGLTGLLTPEGDVSAFAAAIVALVDDEARRQAMGRRASAKIARDHTIGAAAARLDDILNSVTRREAA